MDMLTLTVAALVAIHDQVVNRQHIIVNSAEYHRAISGYGFQEWTWALTPGRGFTWTMNVAPLFPQLGVAIIDGDGYVPDDYVR